jgi:polar amino acid transport system substrate-binding protein
VIRRAAATAIVPVRRLLAALLLVCAASAATAQTPATGAPQTPDIGTPLRIGIYECPPFVIREDDGAFSGVSIHLWQGIAEQLALAFQYVESDLPGLLDGVASGEFDAAISCVSITPEREEFIDFSHSFYETHLSIAVREQGIGERLAGFLGNRQALIILGAVFGLAGLVGGLFYLIERGSNKKLYSRPTLAGRMTEAFIMGLLFITRGPVNYYEFHTLAGRVLTVLLAVFTTLFLASFTAILASSFTIDRLNSRIGGPEDLESVTVGAKASSTSSAYLEARGIVYRAFDDHDAILAALESGLIDAAVGDDPILKYEIRQGQENGRFKALTVLPHVFDKQNYGILLPEGSQFVEDVNRRLLRVRDEDGWARLIAQLFGDQT